jgi:hypothetical protein
LKNSDVKTEKFLMWKDPEDLGLDKGTITGRYVGIQDVRLGDMQILFKVVSSRGFFFPDELDF